MKIKTDILLLYFYREPFGPTVMEHLDSFEKYSVFQISSLNLAENDATDRLRKHDPKAIILHYTLFGMQYYLITEEQAWVVGESQAVKIAFFQDEYHRFPKRCNFIDEYGIDVVYTLLEPQYFKETYYKYCNAPVILHTLAGYVSEELIEISHQLKKEMTDRHIDVGYRGHELDIIYGKGGQEKFLIGNKFKSLTQNTNLKLDVETSVAKRIYGEQWHHFIASCKTMLGVEAGVSAFDIDDKIRLTARSLRRGNTGISDQELWQRVIAPHEEKIYYRTISPRHFEAAALGTVQILFEGSYTGILEPWRHYIPLKKDFSNLDEILSVVNDSRALAKVAENARQTLIDSGRYHYREFIFQLDRQLKLMGLRRSTAAITQ